MKSLSTIAAGLVMGVIMAVAPAAPSLADASSWSQTQNTTQPTIYQTNWTYLGTPFTAPSTPPGAIITSVAFSWSFLYLPPGYPASPYKVFLCSGTGATNCTAVTPAWSAQGWSSTTNYFNGMAASTAFQYKVYITAPTTYVFPPPYKPSKTYSVTVNYSY